MKFTDLFINKPVLSCIISLLILIFGLQAASKLDVRQFPKLSNAVINVATSYVGANAALVEGYITTPLEREVASAEGIDYLMSASGTNKSIIKAYLKIDADPDVTLTQIMANINRVRNELPQAADSPLVSLATAGRSIAAYIVFYSDVLEVNQISDYLVRVIEPKLATVDGVQRISYSGDQPFAVRIWLNPERLAAFNLTAFDIQSALRRNNLLTSVGKTRSLTTYVDLNVNTDLDSVEQFQQLIISKSDEPILRLGDVARVELGSEEYTRLSNIKGKQAVFMAVNPSPDANILEVMDDVNALWRSEIQPQLPVGIEGDITYDATLFVRDAIQEVAVTIAEAIVIVIIVIFLFLGSMRSAIIPAVTVPLSLIGAFSFMLLAGYTLNLLTLLAMVLAIGIVVDDAIIMLENIHRYIEEGMEPIAASYRGARELAWPVISMTTTLVAVYLPIGMLGGITGTLFKEFAFTLAASVLISGVIALTLSPMMCGRLLKPDNDKSNKLQHILDQRLYRLREAYRRGLHALLDDKKSLSAVGLLVLASCYFLFVTAPSELAPMEDASITWMIAESDPAATPQYIKLYADEIDKVGRDTADIYRSFQFSGNNRLSLTGNNGAFGLYFFTPADQRVKNTSEILKEEVLPQLSKIAGLNAFAVAPPPLPSGGTLPIEFVVGSVASPLVLQEYTDEILAEARKSKQFIFLNSNLKIDKQQIDILIDREKAAQLGVDISRLSSDLSVMLSGAYTNRFSMGNRAYKVITQVEQSERITANQLEGYYTRSENGVLIPIGNLVHLEQRVEPQQLLHFQQLNSVIISGLPRPGVSLGEALKILEDAAEKVLPADYSVDYAGESRQFKYESSALQVLFFFSLLLIYLVLAAQFESWIDPLIILVTVPMAISGALLVLNILALFQVPGATLNIYTQVGLVTLIGVISKHGILIVDFANRLQANGLSKRAAIEHAAALRLRPVLMTTAALVFAMFPLLFANGAGAVSRFSLGVVIASGMTIGTMFTLFILPLAYLWIAKNLQGTLVDMPASELLA